MFVSSPYSYIEVLTPDVMVLGDRAFGSWEGHQGGTVINGTHVLVNLNGLVVFLTFFNLSLKFSRRK